LNFSLEFTVFLEGRRRGEGEEGWGDQGILISLSGGEVKV
jgi:hypothetical protein